MTIDEAIDEMDQNMNDIESSLDEEDRLGFFEKLLVQVQGRIEWIKEVDS